MGSLSWAGKSCSACVCEGNCDVKSVTHWGIPHQFGTSCVVVQCPLVRWLFRKTKQTRTYWHTLTWTHNVRNVLPNNIGFTGKSVFCSLVPNSLKTLLGICYNISFEKWVRKLNLRKDVPPTFQECSLSHSLFFSFCSEWDLIHSRLSL